VIHKFLQVGEIHKHPSEDLLRLYSVNNTFRKEERQ